MGWDLNPRNACTFAGFQDRCYQPLSHPSSLFFCTRYGGFGQYYFVTSLNPFLDFLSENEQSFVMARLLVRKNRLFFVVYGCAFALCVSPLCTYSVEPDALLNRLQDLEREFPGNKVLKQLQGRLQNLIMGIKSMDSLNAVSKEEKRKMNAQLNDIWQKLAKFPIPKESIPAD